MSQCCNRDLVRGSLAGLLWGVPTLLIVIGVFVPSVRAALWIPSFVVMGVACVVNARGCGRVHCYITGPLFLLAALAVSLDALAIVTIRAPFVIASVVVGTLLAYGLEWVRGKYVDTSTV